ncbi:MAG: ChbG/HpnK family deacetylase [Planctomycetota bacterium]
MRVALHADDLGQSPAISAGILEAFRAGLLTGSSILANAPHAARSLAGWKTLEEDRRKDSLPSQANRSRLDDPKTPFDLGVHLNLSQGRPLATAHLPQSLLDGEGCFRGLHTLVQLLAPGASKYGEAIRRELSTQIEFVLDHSIHPSRLDGHQYCELIPVVGQVVHALAQRYGITAVRVAREPGVLGTLASSRGARGLATWPAAITKQVLAGCYAAQSRRAGLHHPQWFFGTVTAGRVGPQQIDRFLNIAARRDATSIEIGLHPARRTGSEACDDQTSAGAGRDWKDPLAELRHRELEWLVDGDFTEWLRSRGVRLGRVSGSSAPPSST